MFMDKMEQTPSIEEQKFYHSLWYNRNWIYRRIDEIHIIKSDQYKIKSTFDLDIGYLREKLKINKQQVALPLMSLVRSPILDIDVDLNGIPQSLAGSSISANITRCILLQDIEANIKLNYNSRKWLSSILYKWLLSGNERILQDANAETEAVIRYYHHVNRGRTITPEDENKLRIEKKNLGLKIKSLNFLMGESSLDMNDKPNLISNKYKLKDVFIAVVLINLPENIQRAKLTFTVTFSVIQDNENKWVDYVFPFFPAKDTPYKIAGTLLGQGTEERYHCRINAPKGHYITKVEIFTNDNSKKTIPIKGTHDNLNRQNGSEQDIIDLRIGSFPENTTYLEIKDETQVGKGRYTETNLAVYFEPFAHIFMTRAYVSILLLTVYLGMTIFKISDNSAYATCILAVIFTFPNWFNINEDHDYVRATLYYHKMHLGILSGACILLGLISHNKQIIGEWCIGILIFLRDVYGG